MAFDSEPTLPAVCVCSRCTRRDEAWARADALRVRVVFLEDHVAGDACRSPVSAIVIDANDNVYWNTTQITSDDQLNQYLQATLQIQPEPELHFQPMPDARYEKVDKVLAIIKRSGISKLGFIGNEQYANDF